MIPPLIALTEQPVVQFYAMPSIKKRVTGFIRQFSAPSGAAAAASHGTAASAAKEAVKGKSKSCGGVDTAGGHINGPCKSPKMDSSKCHPDGFIRKYLNG